MKQRQCCDLSGDARTLILSQRAWNKLFYIPLVYEFEDLIASVDSAHILAPPFLHTGRMDAMLYRGSNFLRARYGRITDPGIPSIELERDYDLFFCLLNFAYEVPSFRRLEKLRSRAKHAVCMFVEVWSSHAEQYRRSLELLNELEFDHVFVNLSACLPAVRKVLRRPCSFLPLAVDARRFAPWPDPPARVIDYYSMGRRSEANHKALMQHAGENGRFYFFDSAVRSSWNDCFDHRRLLAGLLQRTRFLLAHKPSLRTDQVIGSDDALTARLFEGAASGTVMLGTAPAGRDFEEHFDWADAVIPAPFESDDIAGLLDNLERQPERIALARQNNIVQCLLRHDWSYRWQRILESAGLDPLPALRQRQAQLRQAAEQISMSNAVEAFA
jgi:hypothetical protein